MRDAKLSSSQRKKLKSSSFCGPNRSFPAHDCPHVRAGFRLLNRAKVSSSTKARIRACLNRRNSSMGCGVNSSDEEKPDTAIELLINSEDFEATREFLEFVEELESSRTIQDQDSLRSRAAGLLSKLREKRTGSAGDKEGYLARQIDSLLHSLMDEIEEVL